MSIPTKNQTHTRAKFNDKGRLILKRQWGGGKEMVANCAYRERWCDLSCPHLDVGPHGSAILTCGHQVVIYQEMN